LEDFLLSSDEESSEEEEEQEEEQEEEEEEEKVHHDASVSPEKLQDLTVANVTSPTGEKVSLQFEDVDRDNAIDVLVDEGSMIIENVSSIILKKKTVEFHDGEEWHVFTYKKIPSSWKKTFDIDSVYGVD
jgi:hypothetical protein